MKTNETNRPARGRFCQARHGLFFLLGFALAPVLPAASLTGTVLEDGSGDALPGVMVTVVTETGGRLPPTVTDGNGVFTVSGVTAGNVTIEYSTGGYLQNPTRKACLVSEPQCQAEKTYLFKKAASSDYLLKVANRLVLLAQGDPEAASKQWQWYENLPIALSDKTRLAQAVMQRDPRLGRLTEEVDYRGLDVDVITKYETAIANLYRQPGVKLELRDKLPAKTIEDVIKAQKQMLPAMERVSFEHAIALERDKLRGI